MTGEKYQEYICHNGKEYILATSPLADRTTRIIKHNESFAVFDPSGDIIPIGSNSHGIYHDSTRHVSRLQMTIEGCRPLLLSSSVLGDNSLLTVDLTNPDVVAEGKLKLQKGSIHIGRTKFLQDNICYEKIQFSNHSTDEAEFDVTFECDCDYSDIFEIRGVHREKKNRPRDFEHDNNTLYSEYIGFDEVKRTTRLQFEPAPRFDGRSAYFHIRLGPRDRSEIVLIVHCFSTDRDSLFFGPSTRLEVTTFARAIEARNKLVQKSSEQHCRVVTSNDQLNEWLERSTSDLHMMQSETRLGPYPFAGLPWYNTVFGRDGIITGMQTLWWDPAIARSVLSFLSQTQAVEVDDSRDAEPGKILHEMRSGELVNIGEVPFKRYYGTADATPLFIILAGQYFHRTGDRALLEKLWPSIQAGLNWIDHYGDIDGDGFVEYQTHAQEGLRNQGWKDSHDSIFHDDGSFPDGPIALCEVQAYVYQAKEQAAFLAKELRMMDDHERLLGESRKLQKKFEDTFWSDELGCYGIALDGKKRLCRVVNSNSGHALFSGIASWEHGQIMAETLMGPAMFSGWGIRTISDQALRYNPMSYHNGSIWPHDNSMIAEGFSRYGRKDFTDRILSAFFDMSLQFELHRLPELFCGFPRRERVGPTLYPVACSPQAWASASVFLLLKAMLGLNIDAPGRTIQFYYPMLPNFIDRLRIENLDVGGCKVDLLLTRHGMDVGLNVLRKEGKVDILITK